MDLQAMTCYTKWTFESLALEGRLIRRYTTLWRVEFAGACRIAWSHDTGPTEPSIQRSYENSLEYPAQA